MSQPTQSYVSGTPAAADVVQGPLRNLVQPEAQIAARTRVAKALLPAPPEQLVPALLFLTWDADAQVRATAKESLGQLPRELLQPILKDLKDEALLDAAARALAKQSDLAVEIALNHKVADDTLRWLGSAGDMKTCEVIARNQVRSLRHPAIIEAVYLNPAAPQGMVAGLIEFAVRSGLNLDHLPGFRETRALLLGEEEDDSGPGLSDAEFASAMLMAASHGEQVAAVLAQAGVDPAVDEVRSHNLAALISRMSVAQKVRLAMVGDAATRKLLIRDPKKIVAFAVLKSPRLTEGEVTVFASNKALSEDLLSIIGRNRQWTKDYATKKALVFNPKTPLAISMQFLRHLTAKDLKDCSGSRDVNGNISRAAKRMIVQASENK